MKEKRYFCDTRFYKSDNTIFLILALSVLICAISYNACTNMLISEYEHELNSYSKETYKELVDIEDMVIEKGVGINLASIPENVVEYEITYKNNETTFTYYFDNNKDMLFVPSTYRTLTLSDNFNVISEESNYSSEETFVKATKSNITDISLLFALFIFISSLFSSLIIILIAGSVSKKHKARDLSKANKE